MSRIKAINVMLKLLHMSIGGLHGIDVPTVLIMRWPMPCVAVASVTLTTRVVVAVTHAKEPSQAFSKSRLMAIILMNDRRMLLIMMQLFFKRGNLHDCMNDVFHSRLHSDMLVLVHNLGHEYKAYVSRNVTWSATRVRSNTARSHHVWCYIP